MKLMKIFALGLSIGMTLIGQSQAQWNQQQRLTNPTTDALAVPICVDGTVLSTKNVGGRNVYVCADTINKATAADTATSATTATTATTIDPNAKVNASNITGVPTCPSGQYLTYDGTAFSCVVPAAAAVLGVGSCDAAQLVVGGKTAKQCCDAGGNVVSAGSGSFLCKVSGSTCPAGWSAYLNWTTTSPGSSGQVCNFMGYGECNIWAGYSSCTTSNHSFSNALPETCSSPPAAATANVIERGCQ